MLHSVCSDKKLKINRRTKTSYYYIDTKVLNDVRRGGKVKPQDLGAKAIFKA